MKVCSKCKVPQDESCFYKRGDGSNLPSSWCSSCARECAKRCRRRRRLMGLCNCGRLRVYKKSQCEVCRAYTKKRTAEVAGSRKRNLRKTRDEVINAYGGRCACCGETEKYCLQLHHINNDGAKHRREMGGNRIIWWARRNNYPSILELLCANCHSAFTVLGYCPHQLQLQWVA